MLIALVVIGIISAITIPSVTQSVQKKEHVERLKKAHSVLSQAVIKIAVNEGLTVGDFSMMNYHDFFRHFSKVVSVNKICSQGESGCFVDYPTTHNGVTWYNSNGGAVSLVTTDGIAYNFVFHSTSCQGLGLSEADTKNCTSRFMVDVNGEKLPNRFGHDIFFFGVVNGKGIVPAGSYDASGCTFWGTSCAARVLKEDKISY